MTHDRIMNTNMDVRKLGIQKQEQHIGYDSIKENIKICKIDTEGRLVVAQGWGGRKMGNHC